MSPKSDPIVSLKVRLRRQLRQRLETEAKNRGCSVNYEAMSRLERSFELGSMRKLEDIAFDMNLNWLRFADRFIRLELEENLAQALAKAEDLQQVRALARAWLKTKETAETAARELERGKP
jgi:hypothetical protein